MSVKKSVSNAIANYFGQNWYSAIIRLALRHVPCDKLIERKLFQIVKNFFFIKNINISFDNDFLNFKFNDEI